MQSSDHAKSSCTWKLTKIRFVWVELGNRPNAHNGANAFLNSNTYWKLPSTVGRSRVRVQVPKYGSRFPSTGPSSRVRVQYKQNQYIEVPEYGSRFPSTDFDKNHLFKVSGTNFHKVSESPYALASKCSKTQKSVLVLAPYSETWTRTREPGPVLGNLDPYSFMYSGSRVQHF